ncbi:MAG: hypothetical protein GY943_36180, partial [Chloroflexi bacterium]|nr:hypothetical protein [Chloroflexota bacterium]
KTQARAVQKGIKEQRRQFDQSRTDMLPWMEAGQRSLADLEGQLGDSYEQSAGYQWQVAEGQKAMKSQMAALGYSDSGVHTKAALKWGQGLAAQDYDKWYGRKQQMAGQGQQQSQSLGQLGTNYGNQMGRQYNMLGAVRGSGYAALGNMYSNLGQQADKMLGGMSMGGGTPTQLGTSTYGGF